MRVKEALGQLRVVGKVPDFYSHVSERPHPFKSEDELIREGLETNLEPPWGVLDWPEWKRPPAIPSLENEAYAIRRGMQRVIYPRTETWNLNYEGAGRGTLDQRPNPDNLGQESPSAVPSKRLSLTPADVIFPTAGGSGGFYIVVGLLQIPIAILSSWAIFRVIHREPSKFWRAVLGISGTLAALGAVGGVVNIGIGVSELRKRTPTITL